MNEQMALPVAVCKEPSCPGMVVGSSVTGVGNVCKQHNEIEWGVALRRSPLEWVRELGGLLPTTTQKESR